MAARGAGEVGAKGCARNVALLSFGDEPEEPVDPTLASVKFKSSHDALDDPRLRKEVLDDRGTSATLSAGMEGPMGGQKRKGEGEAKRGDEVRSAGCAFAGSKLTTFYLSSKQKRGKMEPPPAPSTSKLEAAKIAKAKAAPNPKCVPARSHRASGR